MSQHKNKKMLKRRRKNQTAPMILLIGAGVLLLVGAIFAFNRPAGSNSGIEVKGAPGIKVDKETVDLGDIKLGRTVEVSFEISNVGDQNLRFTKAPYVEVLEGC